VIEEVSGFAGELNSLVISESLESSISGISKSSVTFFTESASVVDIEQEVSNLISHLWSNLTLIFDEEKIVLQFFNSNTSFQIVHPFWREEDVVMFSYILVTFQI